MPLKRISRLSDPQINDIRLSKDPRQNDPFDGFDNLCTSSCQIFEQGGTVIDAYGLPETTYNAVRAGVVTQDGTVGDVQTTVPCYVRPGTGEKSAADVTVGVQHFSVFMRPIMIQPSAGGDLVPLSIHHWFQIDGVAAYHNLQNIENAGNANHHLEVSTKLTVS